MALQAPLPPAPSELRPSPFRIIALRPLLVLSCSDKNVAFEQQKRIEQAPPFLEDADVRDTWLSPARHQPAPKALTSRECEIIELIGQGHPSKQIADALKISTNTVNNHRASILSKLGAHSAIEALHIYNRINVL